MCSDGNNGCCAPCPPVREFRFQNGWPIFTGVITSDQRRSAAVSDSASATPAGSCAGSITLGMNQRKRPSSAGSSRELRRRRNNHAFPISDVRSPRDSTPIYHPYATNALNPARCGGRSCRSS